MSDRIIKSDIAPEMFGFFEEISKIPRGSYNTKGIADYLESFATQRGLPCYRDASDNILITKQASVGRENEPPICFQGHTDMVCEKNNGVKHDFEHDPIDIRVENGFVCANGTTLGGDNGVAVAMMLAILDSKTLSHPKTECLFTSNEEVGMLGAKSFDFSKLTSRRLVNIDGGNENEVIVGCAGGVGSNVTLAESPEKTKTTKALKITISGLCGGHSGEDIHRGRSNANNLMARILLEASQKTDIKIVSLRGGSQGNAITRECEAIIVPLDFEIARDTIAELAKRLSAELCQDDCGFYCSTESAETQYAHSCSFTKRLLTLMCGLKTGVIAMSTDVAGVVEWSSNLGIAKCDENGAVLTLLTRSGIESRLDYSISLINSLAEVCGATTSHYDRYMGWGFRQSSPLRDEFIAASHADVTIKPIHAGLECGTIYSKLPDIDMISVGPTAYALHSPDERFEIASAEHLWKTICEMLEK